ncbi:putative selenium-binding protein [Helianthus annuus]|nr:putative selenium-binding protein [Helianthus annuus]
MVSCLGDKDGKAEGNGFLLLDSDFNVKGRCEKPGHSPLFGYDYWYQPRHKTMINTSWGAPAALTHGFNLQHVSDGLYGCHLHVYSWPEGEHVSDVICMCTAGPRANMFQTVYMVVICMCTAGPRANMFQTVYIVVFYVLLCVICIHQWFGIYSGKLDIAVKLIFFFTFFSDF